MMTMLAMAQYPFMWVGSVFAGVVIWGFPVMSVLILVSIGFIAGFYAQENNYQPYREYAEEQAKYKRRAKEHYDMYK
jgi:cytochrome c-type biogenesis protein CcmH/NrfF